MYLLIYYWSYKTNEKKKWSVKREGESSTRSGKGLGKKKALELCLLHPKKKYWYFQDRPANITPYM